MNIKIFVFFFFFIFCLSASAADSEPLVLLIQVQGDVRYTKDGESWNLISRNKFLYDGDRIKTDDSGSCRLINRETDVLQAINSNTEIAVSKQGIKVLQGGLPEPEAAGDIISFLKRKFAKVQKYTMVKRKGRDTQNNYLQIAPEITLSKAYPEIVWENLGPGYSYELIVNGKKYKVPENNGYMVCFKLTDMIPGKFNYSINILYQGELLYVPQAKGTIRWLSESENTLFQKKVSRIHEIAHDNGFLMGNIMDEHGLKVAAMYEFQKFLAENPDINEVRPFLIKVYNDLKLNKMKHNETILYHHNRIISR